MTRLTKPQRRLATIASVLGILQGAAWFVMSLLCIIIYLIGSQSSDVPIPQNPYNGHFLWGYHPVSPDHIIDPHSFQVFMWIYLIADILWIALSLIQLCSINNACTNPVNVMKCWGVITALISGTDFLLVVLIGAEFSEYCLPYGSAECTLTLIPVLVIAARGFILWIVNVSFVYVIYRIIKTNLAGNNLDKKLLYAGTQIPRPTLQKSSSVQAPQQQQQPQSQINNTNANNNYWKNNSSNNNQTPVTYDGKIPPMNPYAYPTQQSNYHRY